MTLRAGCLLSLLLLASCGGRKSEAPVEEARTVSVRTPRAVERPALIRASGSVEAKTTAKLGFEIAGRVAKMLVEEGQAVGAGQTLAVLSAADYEIGARAAQGDADAARALAEKARAGARAQEIEQARAAFEQADDEYRRLEALYQRKSLAPVDFRKIEAKWKAAKEQLELALEGARAEDIRAAEAQAAKAAAGLDHSRKRLADTQLRAPFPGVITHRLASPGDMVSAGTPVAVLMELNPVRVNVGVPEAEIAKIRIGQTARVRIPSLTGQTFTGRVELVGFAADSASRTFAVKILVPNPALTLRAGMVAEAEIEGDRRERVLTLPGDAIVRDPQGATLVYVYFPDKQRVFSRRVQVGSPVDTEFAIVSGLTGKDRVVVAGQQLVREGSLVRTEGAAR